MGAPMVHASGSEIGGAGVAGSPAADRLWAAGGPVRTSSLGALLDATVAAHGDRPAIDFLGRRWTYAELGRLVDRAARGLEDLGVGPGVKVGLCLPNTPYSVIFYFAVAKLGGVVVNYNPLYVARELEHQVSDSGTRIMIALDVVQILPKIAALLKTTRLETVVVCSMAAILTPVKSLLFRIAKRKDIARPPAGDERFVGFERLIANDGRYTAAKIVPERDVAVLQYTGGTTGVPKGAMLSHANLTANVDQIVRYLPAPDYGRERMLGVLPLFHVFAMSVVMNVGIALGAEMILLPRFDLKQVIKVIAKRRPTLFPGVPTIYTAINNAAAKMKGVDLSSLRFCISGGAPLPVEVKHRFEELTGCHLVEGYGLSEASPVVSCNPVVGTAKDGSIGVPAAGTIIELRSPDDDRLITGTDERGELCVRGPQVMLGYWRKPEETGRVFVDGALRTGDVGYRDADGYYYIVDRLKDLIICSGFNVYPRVIEEALYQHPAVAEVTVIGVPDAYRGQAPKAFVRLVDYRTATPEELLQFLAGYVSKIEMPREIEIRAELPKTMIGKLSKKELVADELARAAATSEGATGTASDHAAGPDTPSAGSDRPV